MAGLDIVMAAIVTPRHHPLLEIFQNSFQDDFPLEIVEVPDHGEGDGDFMTESWYHAVEFKARTTLAKLKEHRGKVLLFSDVDIEFFQPVRPVVERLFADPTLKIAMQVEGYPVAQKGFNSGFIGFRCDDRMIQVYEDLCASNIRFATGDQTWLNQNLPGYGITVGEFPREIWAWSQTRGAPPDSIVLHHANWTVGKDALGDKLSKLQAVREVVAVRSRPLQVSS